MNKIKFIKLGLHEDIINKLNDYLIKTYPFQEFYTLHNEIIRKIVNTYREDLEGIIIIPKVVPKKED